MNPVVHGLAVILSDLEAFYRELRARRGPSPRTRRRPSAGAPCRRRQDAVPKPAARRGRCYPNVNTYAWAPGTGNVIVNVRSRTSPCWRTS